MFVKNTKHQLHMDDPLLQLPKYLRETLQKGWAQTFAQEVFPYINEARFSPLYSTAASRPNTPINVIIGLLVLKEMNGLSDDELIGSLHFDFRYQYALWTTSFDKQPVSINTLTNFRNRVIDYEKETGVDLIQEEVKALSEHIAQIANVDDQLMRMDSLMISSSCKKLSRIELIYRVNQTVINDLAKIDTTLIPESCRVYLEKGHKNDTIYRLKDSETENKLEHLMGHAFLLYDTLKIMGEDICQRASYKLLERLIREQTINDEDGRKIKEGKDIAPDSLQNPSDPDATYREKYGANVGYTANIVESIGEDAIIITDYDYKENTYSDTQFSKDVIETKGDNDASEAKKILVDGAYYSHEIDELAKEKGIEMTPGELTGRKPDDNKIAYSKFERDEATNTLSHCPQGKRPETSYYNEKKKTYSAKFSKETCANCPDYEKCPAKKQKKANTVNVSKKRYETDQLRKTMDSKAYQQQMNKRAGVEGMPSVLRRKYDVDHMPVRGLLRTKLNFGFKILAINVKRLHQYTLIRLKMSLKESILVNIWIFEFKTRLCRKNIQKTWYLKTEKSVVSVG